MNLLNNVKLKIFLLIFIFFSSFMGIHEYLYYKQEKKEFKEYLKNFNHTTAKLLEKNINSDLYNLDYTRIKQTLETFNSNYIRDIYILNNKGHIFAQKSNDKIGFKKFNGFKKKREYELLKDFKHMDKIMLAKKELGFLVIENDKKAYLDMIKKINEHAGYMLFISLIFILSISYAVAYFITKPIEKIVNKLKSTGDKEQLAININSDDEFGYLAREIERNHNSLREVNLILERDIEKETANSRKKDELLQEQSLKAALGDMIDIIAHQWKQPLSAISLKVQAFALTSSMGTLQAAQVEEVHDYVNEKVSHMNNTLDEFRNFFRENKKTSEVVLKNIIESTQELLRDLITLNEINVNIKGDLDAKANIVPEELKHVFINLINNAKDAFEENNIENKEITFEIKSSKNSSILHIYDNAGGIPENIIGNIFDFNFTTKESGKGTGVGLYMSKLFIESTGGTIDVRNIDRGACFTLKIPNK